MLKVVKQYAKVWHLSYSQDPKAKGLTRCGTHYDPADVERAYKKDLRPCRRCGIAPY